MGGCLSPCIDRRASVPRRPFLHAYIYPSIYLHISVHAVPPHCPATPLYIHIYVYRSSSQAPVHAVCITCGRLPLEPGVLEHELVVFHGLGGGRSVDGWVSVGGEGVSVEVDE